MESTIVIHMLQKDLAIQVISSWNQTIKNIATVSITSHVHLSWRTWGHSLSWTGPLSFIKKELQGWKARNVATSLMFVAGKRKCFQVTKFLSKEMLLNPFFSFIATFRGPWSDLSISPFKLSLCPIPMCGRQQTMAWREWLSSSWWKC